MTKTNVKIYITLKNGVLDPQGKAIENAIKNIGYEGIEKVKQGKLIEVTVDSTDEGEIKNKIDNICKKLLANTVIENYQFEIA